MCHVNYRTESEGDVTGTRGRAGGGGRDGRPARRTGLIVECDRCALRGVGCGDCAIGAIIGKSRPAAAYDGAELTGEDRRALSVLASAGLGPELLDAPDAVIAKARAGAGSQAGAGRGVRPHARAS